MFRKLEYRFFSRLLKDGLKLTWVIIIDLDPLTINADPHHRLNVILFNCFYTLKIPCEIEQADLKHSILHNIYP